MKRYTNGKKLGISWKMHGLKAARFPRGPLQKVKRTMKKKQKGVTEMITPDVQNGMDYYCLF